VIHSALWVDVPWWLEGGISHREAGALGRGAEDVLEGVLGVAFGFGFAGNQLEGPHTVRVEQRHLSIRNNQRLVHGPLLSSTR
jgi:hypothetical protein